MCRNEADPGPRRRFGRQALTSPRRTVNGNASVRIAVGLLEAREMCLPTVFSLTTVADRVPVDVLVLVAGMVLAPGESAADWWTNTGHSDAVRSIAARWRIDRQ
jgi:hypothetical protein